MARKRIRKTWNLKKYNQFFNHDNKRWEVIHKSPVFTYAVEIDSKGIAGGEVCRFPKDILAT